jgi:hypothetical protein
MSVLPPLFTFNAYDNTVLPQAIQNSNLDFPDNIFDVVESKKLEAESFEEQIFYKKLYGAILFFHTQHQVPLYKLSSILGYSKNHFGCIVREALPIELDKVFVVCSALSVSFVKLMLHACCLEVFTNAKGCLVRMSDYYAKYSGAQINKCGT